MLTRADLRRPQLQAIQHMHRHDACAVWLPMGGGKSSSALTAFSDLWYDGVRSAIVFAPIRVARDVWPDEIEVWAHLQHLKAVPILGSERERLAALNTPADIHLINRENTTWLEQQFIEQTSRYRFKQIRKWPWDLTVLDEAQSWKAQSSQRFKSMKRMRKMMPRIVELTGTPAPNGYRDLWGQIYLLDGGERLGRTESAFLQRWFDAPAEHGFNWTIKPGAAKEIEAAIADIVLTIELDFDGPPVRFNPIKVKLPPAALAAYRKFERTSVLKLNESTITSANAGVLSGQLLQAANGALYTGEGKAYEVLHDVKIQALLEILESLPGPVLIGYGFLHDLDRIGKALTRFCGKTKQWQQLKTAASMKAFKSGLIDYGVLHPGSAGHGLNDLHLSGAEQLVWFGLTNNLELWNQLNARLTGGHRRIGKNVVIHRIIAVDTYDELEVERLDRKDKDEVGLMRALARRYT